MATLEDKVWNYSHRPLGLTPRMACRLYLHAEFVGALAREDPEYLTSDDLATPPVSPSRKLRLPSTLLRMLFRPLGASTTARRSVPADGMRRR